MAHQIGQRKSRATFWAKLTHEERLDIIKGIKEGRDFSEQLAEWRIAEKTLRNYASSYVSMTHQNYSAEKIIGMFPKVVQKRFDDYWVLPDGRYLITSDWEWPDTDYFMLKAMILVAKKYNLDRHVLAGDFIANSNAGISSHKPRNAEDIAISHAEVLDSGRELLHAFGKQFIDSRLITGNHEDMLNRATEGDMSVDEWMLGKNIHVSTYTHLWIKSKRGWVHISHPKNYAPNSLALGIRLYNKAVTPDGGKPAMMMYGHTHQESTGWSTDNLCRLVGLGTNRDPELTAYISKSTTAFPQWNRAFAMMIDGYEKVFSRNGTNWLEELGPKHYDILMRQH